MNNIINIISLIISIVALILAIFTLTNRNSDRFNPPKFFIKNYSKCICILTVKPHPIILQFLYELKKQNQYDIYLLCDDNSRVYTDDIINIIQIDDKECKKNNFINAVAVSGPKKAEKQLPISWDKALYFFCNHNYYDYYWFIEDDVFIPTVNTISNIDSKYSTEDILSSKNEKNDGNSLDKWHWPKIKKLHKNRYLFELPFYNTMACAIRLSKRMLISIKEFVLHHKTLCYLEYFFNTLAMKNKYKVKSIAELKYITFNDKVPTDIKKTHLYHPVKNLNTQQKLRQL